MTQTFRDFFRSEVISATEGIAVLDVTLVFTDLKGSTALYERIGDLNAYIQVQRHFQHLLDVTVRHNGAVTKTIGDAVMAAFSTAADAVQAALEMREAVDELNRDRRAAISSSRSACIAAPRSRLSRSTSGSITSARR